MLQRILFGYAGAILLSIVLLLILMALDKFSGHHASKFVIVLGAPVGLSPGFVISDRKRRFAPNAILMRTIIAVGALAVWFVCFAEIALATKQGWVTRFIPIVGLLVAALASEFVLRGSARDPSAEKELG